MIILEWGGSYPDGLRNVSSKKNKKISGLLVARAAPPQVA
jgi:hypothetical protein